jgi:hypothetical protein
MLRIKAWSPSAALLPLLLTLFTTPAAAQQIAIRSGLPWASGTTGPVAAFGAWRGRAVDLRTVFWGRSTWRHMIATGKQEASTLAGSLPMAIGFPMVPDTHRGQLQECARGDFDGLIRTVRDTMLAHGWRGSYVRLGWEANRINHSPFAWAARGNGATWVGCFQRWVGILNPYPAKNFVIVWNMDDRGDFPYPIRNLWPGSDVVDIVGSQFYDRNPNAAAAYQELW